MAVTLERAKKHIRVDHDDEDDLINLYVEAANGWALKYCRLDAVPTGAEAEFDAAVLLTMAGMYEHREADVTGITYTEIPTARRLIDPYRRLSV